MVRLHQSDQTVKQNVFPYPSYSSGVGLSQHLHLAAAGALADDHRRYPVIQRQPVEDPSAE